MNKRYPRYPDDADYQTNAPSYYEDLARKQKLIEMLSKRIWEYENTLNETLEQIEQRLTDYIQQNDLLMNERLENWDQRIDEMPEEMRSLFVTWLNDGTLEQIINHDVLGNKADKTYVDDLNENLTSQLAQTRELMGSFEYFGGVMNVEENQSHVLENIFETYDKITLNVPTGYVHLNGLTIPDGKQLTLNGSGKDKTKIVTSEEFIKNSKETKLATNVLGGVEKGVNKVPLNSVNNVVVGDIITFHSSEKMEETSRNVDKRHTALITKLNGNEVEIDTPFPNDFNENYAITVKVFSDTQKIRITNMSIEGEFEGFVFDLEKLNRFELEHVNLNNRYSGYQGLIPGGSIGSSGGQIHGVRLRHCMNSFFYDVHFNSLGYGIMPTNASVNTTVERSTATNGRHLSAPTGCAQNTVMNNCTAYNCYAGFDSHQTAYDTYHTKCTSYGNEIEVKFRGRTDYIENCTFDSGLEAFSDLIITEVKSIINTSFIGQLRVNGNVVNIKNVKGTHLTSIFGGNVWIDGLYINKVDSSIENTLPTPDNNFLLIIDAIHSISYRNVTIQGPHRNSPNPIEKTSNNLIGFSFRVGRDTMIVNFDNVVVDGFDVGFDMPVAKDLKHYSFNNVMIKNCVEGINTSQNYKDNVDISRVYFTDNSVDITAPDRLRESV